MKRINNITTDTHSIIVTALLDKILDVEESISIYSAKDASGFSMDFSIAYSEKKLEATITALEDFTGEAYKK